MKKNKIGIIILISLGIFNVSHSHTEKGGPLEPDGLLEIFEELFEPSEYFEDGVNFIWSDFQVFSTRGKREDKTKTRIPMIGLNYEKQLFYNLGLRINVSTNWWEEEKALVVSGEREFTESFKYQYWTAGGGLTWHFNLSETKFDPYVGLMLNVRYSSAECNCLESSKTKLTGDILIGTRYKLGESFFASLELGRHGTGYLKGGVGFKF